MAAAIRIGTCSWADDALVKHWYPPGTPPRARLAWYAEHFSTVEVDSTYYRVPTEEMVRGWAERSPDGFVMHVKAFGLMTRHPVKLDQVPPELREGLPVDERGRVDRPSRDARSVVFRAFLDALQPLRDAGKLGGILFQLPPYVTWKPASLDYLEWARGQLGDDEMLVEPRHRSWFAEDVRAELLRFLEERRMSWVAVDAPKVEAGNVPATLVAATTPLAYVRLHGRNAATWNARGGSAAERFDYLYSPEELAEWVPSLRRLGEQAEQAYVFFNNNNQTDGAAQAPAGAFLLRKLLTDDGVPTA
ncbi:MAG TPA: DUF72 domain-containing protein [Gaiellaceae bacterium]|nr:DUF72 domain-containing protein [Gaiellaceae bacterium]